MKGSKRRAEENACLGRVTLVTSFGVVLEMEGTGMKCMLHSKPTRRHPQTLPEGLDILVGDVLVVSPGGDDGRVSCQMLHAPRRWFVPGQTQPLPEPMPEPLQPRRNGSCLREAPVQSRRVAPEDHDSVDEGLAHDSEDEDEDEKDWYEEEIAAFQYEVRSEDRESDLPSLEEPEVEDFTDCETRSSKATCFNMQASSIQAEHSDADLMNGDTFDEEEVPESDSRSMLEDDDASHIEEDDSIEELDGAAWDSEDSSAVPGSGSGEGECDWAAHFHVSSSDEANQGDQNSSRQGSATAANEALAEFDASLRFASEVRRWEVHRVGQRREARASTLDSRADGMLSSRRRWGGARLRHQYEPQVVRRRLSSPDAQLHEKVQDVEDDLECHTDEDEEWPEEEDTKEQIGVSFCHRQEEEEEEAEEEEAEEEEQEEDTEVEEEEEGEEESEEEEQEEDEEEAEEEVEWLVEEDEEEEDEQDQMDMDDQQGMVAGATPERVYTENARVRYSSSVEETPEKVSTENARVSHSSSVEEDEIAGATDRDSAGDTASLTVEKSKRKKKIWHQDNTPLVAPPGQRIPGMPSLEDIANPQKASGSTAKSRQEPRPQRPPAKSEHPWAPPAKATEEGILATIRQFLDCRWRDVLGNVYEFEFSKRLRWICYKHHPHSGSKRYWVSLDLQSMQLWWPNNEYTVSVAKLSGKNVVRWYHVKDNTAPAFSWSRLNAGSEVAPAKPKPSWHLKPGQESSASLSEFPSIGAASDITRIKREEEKHARQQEWERQQQSKREQREESEKRKEQAGERQQQSKRERRKKRQLKDAAKSATASRLQDVGATQRADRKVDFDHHARMLAAVASTARQALPSQVTARQRNKAKELSPSKSIGSVGASAHAENAKSTGKGNRKTQKAASKATADEKAASEECAKAAEAAAERTTAEGRVAKVQEEAAASEKAAARVQPHALEEMAKAEQARDERKTMEQVAVQAMEAKADPKISDLKDIESGRLTCTAPEPSADAKLSETKPDQDTDHINDAQPAKFKCAALKPAVDGKGIAVNAGVEADTRPHIHVALLGSQGAGKSVLCGSILREVGAWDERLFNKHKKECEKEGISESRRYEEGETSKIRFTLLDAPGGRKYLPEAVSAISNADVCVVVVSTKEAEATPSECSHFLREQIVLCQGLGVRSLIVAVSKMSEAKWAQERFESIRNTLLPVISECGLSASFAPVDGLSGEIGAQKAPWFSGKPLLEELEEAAVAKSRISGASSLSARLLVQSALRGKGGMTLASGRVECGSIRPGLTCMVAPMQSLCTIQAVLVRDTAVASASAGDAAELQLAGLPPDAASRLRAGAVVADSQAPVRAVAKMKVEIDILQMPDKLPVLTVGFKGVLHIHSATVDFEIVKLLEATTSSTGQTEQKPKGIKVGQRAVVVLQLQQDVAAEEFCEGHGRLGCLVLRAGDATVAVGRVRELPKEASGRSET